MITTAANVFADFVEIVLERGAFSPEERGRPTHPGDSPRELSADRARAIARDKAIDSRVPYLMRVSGKGGRAPEGKDPARYERFRNVTLLDHLTSVVRGTLVISAIDLAAAGVASDRLPARLARLAAIAFLHDGDKILGRDRSDALTPDDFDHLATRYAVDQFLAKYDVTLGGADLLQLVSNIEITRQDLLVKGARLPSREEVRDCAYVRLADRLDGLLLDETKGPAAVVDEIAAFRLRTEALTRDWRALTIRAPQTPFLLDALQAAFSDAVHDRAGMPPLVEVHLDGELTLVAPTECFDGALDDALNALGREFAKGIRVEVNTRGTRDLLDGRGGVVEVVQAFEREPRQCSKALFIHRGLAEDGQTKSEIETHFDEAGLGPKWPDLGKAGQHLQPFPIDDRTDPVRRRRLVDAAVIAVGLACPAPEDPGLRARTPDDAAREGELVTLLANHAAAPPDWLTGIDHKLSRHTLLGLHAAMAARDPGAHEALLGPAGLVELWLRGDSARPGILQKNEDPEQVLGDAARTWLRSTTHGAFVQGVQTEDCGSRCHFTNLPVAPESRIDTKTALYGVNVSAFSGREGRPESHTRAVSQTLVSPLARAEHRLRALVNGNARGDVPVFVSSPGSNGLFWSLRLTRHSGETPTDLSLYDVLRAKKEAGKPLFIEADAAESGTRTLIGRFTTLPTRLSSSGNTPGLVGFAAMVIDAAKRSGRPIHVFRGLPRRSNAFVAIDCLPRPVERALEKEFGSAELRLEDLERASRRLRLVDRIIETSGLGPDMALEFADPATRLGAGCLALATLDRAADADASLRAQIENLTRTAFMEEQDDPIIAFAKAMTRVQRGPGKDASNAEKDLGMRVALEALEGARGISHNTRESRIDAIAGELENELSRGRYEWPGKTFGHDFPGGHARAAAEIFVDDVWAAAFRGRSPASRSRRTAFAIYRFAFLEHSRAKTARNAEADGLLADA